MSNETNWVNGKLAERVKPYLPFAHIFFSSLMLPGVAFLWSIDRRMQAVEIQQTESTRLQRENKEISAGIHNELERDVKDVSLRMIDLALDSARHTERIESLERRIFHIEKE